MCAGPGRPSACLFNGGTLERAQAIAAHESPRTTKLYEPAQNIMAIAGRRPPSHVRANLWDPSCICVGQGINHLPATRVHERLLTQPGAPLGDGFTREAE